MEPGHRGAGVVPLEVLTGSGERRDSGDGEKERGDGEALPSAS